MNDTKTILTGGCAALVLVLAGTAYGDEAAGRPKAGGPKHVHDCPGMGMGMGMPPGHGFMGMHRLMEDESVRIPHLPPGNARLELEMQAEIMQKVGEVLAKYAAQVKEAPAPAR